MYFPQPKLKHEPPEKTEAIRFVLELLLEKPGTQDSLSDIVYSWLRHAEIARRPERVQRVLKSLVRAGLIVEIRRAASPPTYRLNPEKLPEIRAMLGLPESD